MAVFSYSNGDGEFTDGVALAQGSDVLTRFNDIKAFLNTVNEYTNKIAILVPETVTNSAAETIITGITIGALANTILAGSMYQGELFASMNTTAGASNDIRLRVRYGGIAGTVLLDSGVIPLAFSLTNEILHIRYDLTCLTIGAAGTMEAQGMIDGRGVLDEVQGLGTSADGAMNTAALVIDTTINADIVLTVQFTSAVVGHTISCRTGSVIKI